MWPDRDSSGQTVAGTCPSRRLQRESLRTPKGYLVVSSIVADMGAARTSRAVYCSAVPRPIVQRYSFFAGAGGDRFGPRRDRIEHFIPYLPVGAPASSRHMERVICIRQQQQGRAQPKPFYERIE